MCSYSNVQMVYATNIFPLDCSFWFVMFHKWLPFKISSSLCSINYLVFSSVNIVQIKIITLIAPFILPVSVMLQTDTTTSNNCTIPQIKTFYKPLFFALICMDMTKTQKSITIIIKRLILVSVGFIF